MKKETRCCFCNGLLNDVYGNNPWPFYQEDHNKRCCNNCNQTIVIPKRIELMTQKRNEY